MATGVPITSLGDLINLTLEHWPQGKFTETQKYTDYPLMRLFFEEAKVSVQGGKSITHRIRLRPKGTAQMTQLYGTQSRTIVDTSGVAEVPWRNYDDATDYDDREIDMNSSGEQIVDLMQQRESATAEGVCNLIEEQLAQAPSTSSDATDLYGVGYWLRPLAASTTDTTGGFNGQTPLFRDGTQTGSTAGIDASTAANARWRNWAATHSGEMTPETIKTLRRAMTNTGFMMLSELTGKTQRGSGRRVLLMDHPFADQFEDLVNRGPDDLGGQLAKFKDPSIRNVPIIRTPVLSNVSFTPVYGVYTKNIYGTVLKDRWMKRGKAINSREQVHVYSVPLYGTCQLDADDLRSGGFVVHAVR